MQSGQDNTNIQRWLGDLQDGIESEKIDARRGLARVFEQRGMLEEATDLLIANVRAGVRDPDAYRWLARLYRAQGNEALAAMAAAEAARDLPILTKTVHLDSQTPATAPAPLANSGQGRTALWTVGWLIVIGAVALWLLAAGRSSSGGSGTSNLAQSSSKTSADNGVVMRSRLGQNPLRDGPFQFGGGSYRVEWDARDVTPREPCGHFVWVEPTGRSGSLAGLTPAVRGEVPAGSTNSGVGTKYLSAGSYDVTVMSGCGEWTVTVRRE